MYHGQMNIESSSRNESDAARMSSGNRSPSLGKQRRMSTNLQTHGASIIKPRVYNKDHPMSNSEVSGYGSYHRKPITSN